MAALHPRLEGKENIIYILEGKLEKKCKTAILLYCFHTTGVLHIFMLYNFELPFRLKGTEKTHTERFSKFPSSIYSILFARGSELKLALLNCFCFNFYLLQGSKGLKRLKGLANLILIYFCT